MTPITAECLKDVAHIEHARQRAARSLQDTHAWRAAERIEGLERQLTVERERAVFLDHRLARSLTLLRYVVRIHIDDQDPDKAEIERQIGDLERLSGHLNQEEASV